jgi:hypothetical protein
MKKTHTDAERRWQASLELARADMAPPVDVNALLRVVRQAPLETPAGVLAEFSRLFASRRIVSACLASAAALALLASWEAWTTWESLPWAQLLVSATGGVS